MKIKLLAFLFIFAIGLMCGSASAYTYNGDAKFGDDGWLWIGSGATSGEFETIVDGVNQFYTNNTAEYAYRLTPGLNATTGYTIEMKFKLESDSDNFYIDIRDSTYEWKATINPTSIYAHTESVTTDTADDDHVWHFVRKGQNFTMYRDYVDIWNTTTANDATTYDRLDIGESSTSKHATVNIDYLDVQEYNIPTAPEEPVEEYDNPLELNYDDWSNLIHNDTIVTYRNITLKNGWNPANEWWGESGGVWATLDNADYKADIRFTAPINQTVQEVGFVAYTCEGNTTDYRLGIQADDGSGEPTGTYISYGIWNTSDYVGSNRFYTTQLLSNVSIVENHYYHLVMEYDSGDIDSSHYVTLKGMKSGDGDTGDGHNGFMPSFNYGGYDPNVAIKDTFYWASRTFDNGSTWYAGANNRESPNFVLNFTDGDQFGAMALHDYEGVDGVDFKGEKIIISNGNKTVDSIKAYFWRESSNVTLYPVPNDSLYYHIQDSDHNDLRNGTLLTPDDFVEDSTGRWFETDFISELELEDGETYYIVFNSPNSNSSCYYGNDASGPVYAASYGYLWSYNLTYGAQDALLVVSNEAHTVWTEYPQNDYSFGLHLVNVTTGTVTMPVINCTDGNVSSNVTLSGIIPNGTSIDIYARYSSDNVTFGDYSLIQESASIETAYTTYDSSQYIQLMAVMETDDADITPEISSLYVQISDTVQEAPLSIVSFTPTDTTPTSTNGTEQTFTANFSKTVDSAEWLINGTHVEWDNSTTSASYTNSTAPVGTYNVTMIATDGITEVSQTWTWTVTTEEQVVDVSDWIAAKLNAQEDTEAALSLASMLPFLLIAATIIIAMFAVTSGIINFESAIMFIIVMLIVSTILMISLPIFNGLYS